MTVTVWFPIAAVVSAVAVTMSLRLDVTVLASRPPVTSRRLLAAVYSAWRSLLMVPSMLICWLMSDCSCCICVSGWRWMAINSLTTVCTSIPLVLPLKASLTLERMLERLTLEVLTI